MADFIKQTVLKEYISSKAKVRVNKTALKKLIGKLNATTRALVREAKRLAKQDKRTTIMPRDIAGATEKIIGRKHLTWQELAKEITRLGPIELGNISKAIDEYIEKQKPK
ncbi:hypothetical protein ES702_02105 [subsurface metagenome]